MGKIKDDTLLCSRCRNEVAGGDEFCTHHLSFHYLLVTWFCCFLLGNSCSNSQQKYQIGGVRTSEIKIIEAPFKLLSNRNKIALSLHDYGGEWRQIKNWNEGRAVVAESDTIVWVGTPVGLVRWNVKTKEYQTYDERNGLNATSINALAIDKTGKLWIAAQQGVVCFSKGIFTRYDYTNSPLPNASMEKIGVDSLNQIVIGFGPPLSGGYYQDGGIARFDGINWKLWRYGSSIFWGPAYSIAAYHDTVWCATAGGLMVIVGDSLKKAPGWIGSGAKSLAIDSGGILWAVATDGKLMKLESGSWTIVLDNEFGLNIWNDPRGGLWLSADDGWYLGTGPFHYDQNLHEVSGIPGQFYAHHARSKNAQYFASMGSGNTYSYTTQAGGLYTFIGGRWEVLRMPATLLENEICGMGVGLNGEVFVSTQFHTQKTDGTRWETIGEWVTGQRSQNTDFRMDGNGNLFTNHNKMYSMWDSFSGFAAGLDFDGFGNLWTTYPLTKYSYPGYSPTVFVDSMIGFQSRPGYYSPQFMDVCADKNENVWAAAWYYGGAMFDQYRWHLLPPGDTTLPNYNYDMVFSDSKGRIWYCTNQWMPNYGFTMYDGNAWRTYYSPQRYRISYVYQMAEDHVGNIWLATGGGLLKYDGSSFQVFDSQNSPLETDYITAVTVDAKGNIWIGTKNGIYIYQPYGPVNLDSYSDLLHIDSLTATASLKKAVVSFVSQSSSTSHYLLQRGRGIHRFWTVAESTLTVQPNQKIVLIDSSVIIGKYFYRIREVTSDGKERSSPGINYSGGDPSVSLIDFKQIRKENKLIFQWHTDHESFVSHYEVWRRKTIGSGEILIKTIKSDAASDDLQLYEAEVDTLQANSSISRYILRVVYLNNAFVDLKTVDIMNQLPSEFTLSQNYPNPFNNSTSFDMTLPLPGSVKFKVYDILGRELSVSFEKYFGAGYNHFTVEMQPYSTGVYFYSIEFLSRQINGKFVVVK